MYNVSSPCQETRPCQKPQPYQELVDQMQMCARRAHYPNMQLYNIAVLSFLSILMKQILPHTSLQQPISILSSRFLSVIIKELLHVMCLATQIASQFAITNPHLNFTKDILLIPIILIKSSLVGSHKNVRVSSYHKNADQNNY